MYLPVPHCAKCCGSKKQCRCGTWRKKADSKPPVEGTKRILAAPAKPSTPTGRAEQFVPGGSIYDGVHLYQVQSILGEGTFGKVAKCARMADKKIVAIKMIKKRGTCVDAQKEVQALSKLKSLDPDKCNIVRWHKHFTDRGCICLEFEYLEKSLSDFMKQRYFRPLFVKEIRPIVQQLANALEHLRTIGLIHADIKLENVMLVNHEKEPFRVKVIDFGLAMSVSAVTLGSNIQTPPYRSPEIILLLPFTQAIDMWSLGCLAVALYLGTLLYTGHNEYDMIRSIVDTQGQPPDSMLNAGQKTCCFFDKVYTSTSSFWKLKSPEQYHRETGIQPMKTRRVKFTSLDGLLNTRLSHSNIADKVVEEADRLMFVDMLKAMLELDASQRVTPHQVLEHDFVKMCHIDPFLRLSPLAQSCFKLMEVCQRPRENGKVVRGSLEQPTSHPGQVSLPAPCAPTANTSKLVKPGVNPRPYNHTQSNGSVHPAPKIVAQSEDGKPMNSKKDEAKCRVNSNAGPSSTCDSRYDQTHLQRLVAPPLNGNAPDLKGMTGDGGKNGLCARPANNRKRVRKAPDAETACRGSSSSATNSLNGELEMRQGPHEDHCYSLQPPDSQTNIEEWQQAKRKVPDCDGHAAERAELQGTLWAQKWQRRSLQ